MMKIKNIKCDYWEHSKLSKDILEILTNTIYSKDKVNLLWDLNCIPKVKKPYFWEFWKYSEYNKECKRILDEVKQYLEEHYLNADRS